jgi:hypothetical protein
MKKINYLKPDEIRIGSEMMAKYPKPINRNNVVNTNSALLLFYAGGDGFGKIFLDYMNPERMVAILFMIITNPGEKQETIEKAATMFRKLI